MGRQSVLFVCLGNICRSPLAEGMFRAEVTRRGLGDLVVVDSCGTSGWHVGEPPDVRSVEVAQRRGVHIAGQRSRQLDPSDFTTFHWLVAMDGDNEQVLRSRVPAGADCRVVRFLEFHPGPAPGDVPDPYYGGDGGFDRVADLLEAGCGRLLDAVVGAGGLKP